MRPPPCARRTGGSFFGRPAACTGIGEWFPGSGRRVNSVKPTLAAALGVALWLVQAGGAFGRPAANHEFASELFGEVRSNQGNVVFSPHSIEGALAMVYNGARGETETEMARVLRIDQPKAALNRSFKSQLTTAPTSADGRGMRVATSVWVREQDAFLTAFSSVGEQFFLADLRQVNFGRSPEAARKTINQWVGEQAAGGVGELIRQNALNPRARLVVVNLARFDTGWATPFPVENTSAAPFHLGGGRTREVQMMRQTATFGYGEDEDVQILELPISSGEQSMLLILPKDPDGLAALERKVAENPGLLAEWRKGLQPTPVDVALPRFTTSFGFSANRALRALGMTNAFSDAADFSGIDGTQELFITEFFHRTVIDVSEGAGGPRSYSAKDALVSGAKDGLVSGAEGGLAPGARSAATAFNGDRPFLFAVGDGETGDVLMSGRISDPGSTGLDGIGRDGRTFRPTPQGYPVFPSPRSSP